MHTEIQICTRAQPPGLRCEVSASRRALPWSSGARRAAGWAQGEEAPRPHETPPSGRASLGCPSCPQGSLTARSCRAHTRPSPVCWWPPPPSPCWALTSHFQLCWALGTARRAAGLLCISSRVSSSSLQHCCWKLLQEDSSQSEQATQVFKEPNHSCSLGFVSLVPLNRN